MNTLAYQIQDAWGESLPFYRKLKDFSNEIVPVIYNRLQADIKEIKKYNFQNSEVGPSDYEIAMELVMIGVFWKSYKFYVSEYQTIVIPAFSALLRLRERFPKHKKHIDRIRGWLNEKILLKKSKSAPRYPQYKHLKKLISWLKSTGDFKEECIRMSHLKNHLKTIYKSAAEQKLKLWYDASVYFEMQSMLHLGNYTNDTHMFIKDNKDLYKFREDAIFCTRREAEYHLNMVMAEIMNQSLKSDFMSKQKKIVLLPLCMSRSGCRSKETDGDIYCQACNDLCQAGKLTKELSHHNIKTILIPHSSDFSKVLARWSTQKDTALVGIACVLNLLTGGYEMKRLKIASQCIFLDYAGCKKHWSSTGIPTQINLSQLHYILGINYAENKS